MGVGDPQDTKQQNKEPPNQGSKHMPNTPADIKSFFATPDKPVSAKEFMDFWKSCSDEDKDYFRSADLG